ncbi:Lar family restriction alleviation protein [Candidatus Darwinibacter acetoxidans]|jgi:Lar family restriction alleviation protein
MQIKRCPFCGGQARVIPEARLGHLGYTVYCEGCVAESGTYATKEKAMHSWNCRFMERPSSSDGTAWRMLSVNEVAGPAWLNCNVKTVYKLTKRADFPAIRVGEKVIRIPAGLLEEWILKQSQERLD